MRQNRHRVVTRQRWQFRMLTLLIKSVLAAFPARLRVVCPRRPRPHTVNVGAGVRGLREKPNREFDDEVAAGPFGQRCDQCCQEPGSVALEVAVLGGVAGQLAHGHFAGFPASVEGVLEQPSTGKGCPNQGAGTRSAHGCSLAAAYPTRTTVSYTLARMNGIMRGPKYFWQMARYRNDSRDLAVFQLHQVGETTAARGVPDGLPERHRG
jgi:hypothetical protein